MEGGAFLPLLTERQESYFSNLGKTFQESELEHLRKRLQLVALSVTIAT
jgi:hypothetical protein